MFRCASPSPGPSETARSSTCRAASCSPSLAKTVPADAWTRASLGLSSIAPEQRLHRLAAPRNVGEGRPEHQQDVYILRARLRCFLKQLDRSVQITLPDQPGGIGHAPVPGPVPARKLRQGWRSTRSRRPRPAGAIPGPSAEGRPRDATRAPESPSCFLEATRQRAGRQVQNIIFSPNCTCRIGATVLKTLPMVGESTVESGAP